MYGTPSTTLSGTIKYGSLVPTGSVSITLNGVPQPASINASTGYFSSSFATGGLLVAGSQYTITYSYAGDANFTAQSDYSKALTVNRASTSTAAANKTTAFAVSVNLSATVAPVAPSTATVGEGTVTFTIHTNDVAATQVGSAGPTPTVVGGYASIMFNPGGLSVGTYKIRANYSGGPNFVTSCDCASGLLTISQAGTTTTMTAAPASVQYSDVVTLTATISNWAAGGANAAGTVTFTFGTQTVGPINVVAGVGTNGTATATPAVALGQGTYTVTATFTSGNTNFGGSTGTTSLTVTQEDARATYTGALFASTSGTSSSTATVTLAATIQDITAVDPAYDANGGDIRRATVTFVNRDAMPNQILCTAAIGLVNAADPKVGTATCSWTANIGQADSASYTVGIIVGNYYTRNTSDDNTVVTVSKPYTSFITGGGYLVMQSSAGLYAGQPGTKNNFGFNVKYNKSGTNLQGNINAIVRNNGRVYQVKGNSMTSLSAVPATGTSTMGTAVFNGKASIQDITDPLNPISIDGNATLQVTMHDYGSPGNTDTIAVTVWNKAGGLWFSSNWDGIKTQEQTLGGGNLSVK